MATDDSRSKPDKTQTAHGSPTAKESGELFTTASEESGENDLGKTSRLTQGWAWIKKNRLRVGVGGLVLAVALLSGVTLTLLGVNHSNQKRIQEAIEALELGDLIQAREIAAKLALNSKKFGRGPADAAFILGMVAADDAEAAWPDDPSSYVLAARYFDIAYPSGFPEKFEFLGLKTYGKVLLRCDRFAESKKVLERALKVAKDKDTAEKNGVRYLLVESDLEAENPDLTEATRQNKAYLKTKGLTEPQRIEGTLQQLQLQARQGKFEDARATLATLPKTPAYSGRVFYAKGRLAMREAESNLAEENKVSTQVRAKLDEAIESFRRAQGHAGDTNPIVPRAQYLIGVCLELLGEDRAAVQQWKQVCEFFPESPEAIASQYHVVEFCFHEDFPLEIHDDSDGIESDSMFTEGIHYLQQMAEALSEEKGENPWITKAELREKANDWVQMFRKAGRFNAAIGVTKAITPIVSKAYSLRLLAMLNQALGQKILDQLEPDIGGEKQIAKRRQARRYLREASLLYAELAKQEKTSKRYPDDLWGSADCALKGGDFAGAVQGFIKYLNTEPMKRNAPALLGLGEAYLSLGQLDEAIDTFEQCIEFYPSDVATFRARLLAAGAWQEKGDLKPAEQLLLENWSAAGITPKSLVWRETLYRLGELYHDIKRYDKAIERLEDAVRRFPDDSRTNLARYLLADSYRLRASEAQERIEKTMTRSILSSQKANIESDFNAAYNQYVILQQRIGMQRGMAELSELENRLLRNSRMFAAGVLFQLEQYRQAIKAYSTVSLHYLGHPISIQAMKQNAQALADLGENEKARILVHRTIVQLEKMGPQQPYEETTLYSYDEWMSTLQQMEKELAVKQQLKENG